MMSPDSPALRTGLRLLEIGLWPVPIHSPHAKVNSPGKQPIGDAWGATKHTAESLRAMYRAHPDAGVGIKLGQDGGVIDVEVDDPATGEDSLAKLLGGECFDTMGWTSRRGAHLLFRWDDRLARYGKTVLKDAALPGLEIRVGSRSGSPKQLQSVCPPSPMTEVDKGGRVISVAPRVWNGCAVIATLPSSFFAVMDALHAASAPKKPEPATTAKPDESKSRYALKALDDEVRLVRAASAGGRNDQLNRSAFAIGQLVGAGAVTLSVAWACLENAATEVGLGDRETLATLRSGFASGQAQPRDLSKVAADKPGEVFVSSLKPPDTGPAASLEDIATAADLVLAAAGIEWLWEGWIQRGVLTLLAAEPGIGKTRFGLDLCRRIYLGLPWPDGSPMTLPERSPTLWIPADNNHAELADLPAKFGFVPEAIYLNTSKGDLYGGTELTTPEQLGRLEFHIRCVNPALVFIDTITNTSDYKSQDTSDAKKQFKPLQEIAKRTGTAIVCVTHLNAAGKTLGRRADEKVRTAIRLEQPDKENQEHRRKLHVTKSNSLMPAALGITMGANGNEYDLDPPKPPDEGQVFVGKAGAGGMEATPRLQECIAWVAKQLDEGNNRVGQLRTAAELVGFSSKTLYKARDKMGVIETESEGRKYWALTEEHPF